MIAAAGSEAIWGQRFQAVLITNRAAARARRQHWVDALSDCNIALRLYPSYLKAIKRRGDLYQVSLPIVILPVASLISLVLCTGTWTVHRSFTGF